MVAVVGAVEGVVVDAGAPRIGARGGLIERPRLLGELRAAAEVPVVVLLAGAGFGKTTLASQWLPDDPAVLLADVVRVLDEFEPLEPRAKQKLMAASIDFSSVLVPRLERTVAARARPFVLVLDDVHRLRQPTAWALVQALADQVPDG